MSRYVTYYRVSTKKQGADGHGINAQKASVQQFLKGNDAEEVQCFTEVGSRKDNNRPILKDAIQLCKDKGAKLLIAKLDRLSGEVEFIFALKRELEEAGIGFVFADYPDAVNNTMMLATLAGFAQNDREKISKRTKDALKAAKAKGVKLGNPDNLTDKARKKAWATISHNARTDIDTRKAFHFIRPLREDGESYQSIAGKLNDEGYRTRRGKQFHPAQARKIFLRFTENQSIA